MGGKTKATQLHSRGIKMKIGIIGHGFVGQSVANAFDSVLISDPAYNKVTIQDVLDQSPDAIFICVPTPEKPDGFVDGSIVKSVIDAIPDGILTIVKSTITPDWLPIGKIGLVMNPEFLTQANAKHEFMNPSMQVFGGDKIDTDKAVEVYKHSSVAKCPEYHTDINTACLVKYCINSFLATKVSFLNELYDLYTTYTGNDWDQLINIVSSDPRIGGSHLNVPNNGMFGFGGACFPKDTSALLNFALSNNCSLNVLNAAISVNDDIQETKNK